MEKEYDKELHTYSVEWNNTDIFIRKDDEMKAWLNLTNKNTFLNEPITFGIIRIIYRDYSSKGILFYYN